MLPLINIAPTPITPQASLVSTPVPDSNTLRVPPSTVAPPVSSAQVDPNASGKNQLLPQTGTTASTPSSPPTVTTGTNNLAPEVPLGAPATLIAQMLGQKTLPPEAQNALRGVLNEYEKVIINSYVKYKPSNAFLPQSEPSSAFSQLVKQIPVQEKPAPADNAPETEDADLSIDESTAAS